MCKLLLLFSLLWLTPIAYGADENQPVSLKGSVNVNMVQVEESLAQMEKLEEKIKRNSQALAYQLNRKNVVHAISPNVIGLSTTLMVIPPAPQPDGSLRMGDLKPISKPMFHTLLSDLRKQVVEMRRTAIVLNNWPQGLDSEVTVPWQQTTDTIHDIVKSCNRLIHAWTNDSASRDALGKELLAIHDQCQKLEDPLDEISRIVKNYDRGNAEVAGQADKSL